MLSLGALVLLTCSGTVLGATTPRPTSLAETLVPTPDDQLFADITKQIVAAIEKNDMAAFGQYIAPDYLLYNADGGTANKAQTLANIGSWSKASAKLVGPIKLTRRGDMAVTVSTMTFSGQVRGQSFTNTLQMMIAWELRNGRWQMVVQQSRETKV